MKLSPFLKEDKKNLKKLTRKQLIQQVIIGIDMNANIQNSYDDLKQVCLKIGGSYEELKSYGEIKEELEDTREALRRSRKLLDSYKHFESLFILEQQENNIIKSAVKGAESATRMYENMSVWQFIKHKFK